MQRELTSSACSACALASRFLVASLELNVLYSASNSLCSFLHMSRRNALSSVGLLNVAQLVKMRRHSTAKSDGFVTCPCNTRSPSVLRSIGCVMTWLYVGMFSATGSIGSLNHLYGSSRFSFSKMVCIAFISGDNLDKVVLSKF